MNGDFLGETSSPASSGGGWGSALNSILNTGLGIASNQLGGTGTGATARAATQTQADTKKLLVYGGAVVAVILLLVMLFRK